MIDSSKLKNWVQYLKRFVGTFSWSAGASAMILPQDDVVEVHGNGFSLLNSSMIQAVNVMNKNSVAIPFI
jgi:hypothetical protein